MRIIYVFAVLVLFASCGDNVIDATEDEKAFLVVRLDCDNGITLYSIEGDVYIRGAATEKSVDAIGGKGYTFTVVPNTKYIVRAHNSSREGRLIGSVTVTSGIPRERVDVTIPCD